MANEKHVELLKGGAEGWNEWRRGNPEIWPDLSLADLRRADLGGADLSHADLSHADFYRASLYRAHLAAANLTGANLSGANLIGANLIGANLSGANLIGANLTGADLSGADLTGANLVDADLTRANLTHANLTRANLSEVNLFEANLANASLIGAKPFGASLIRANLTNANLTRVTLTRANLSNTNLSNTSLAHAKIGSTVFANVDLRTAKGLGSVKHISPSHISTDTLVRSHGQIPSIFLKGCGLSDWQIENVRLFDPALDADQRTTIWYETERIRSEQAFHLFRVFISYARADALFVEALEKRLDEKGVRYWRDVHDMKAGRIEQQIDRAIDLNPLVLLVLSERSLESDWVEWEAAKARELEKQYRKAGNPRDVLCPVHLDDTWKTSAWPGRLRRQIEEYNVLDFSGWEDENLLEAAFAKLYEGVVLNYRPEDAE